MIKYRIVTVGEIIKSLKFLQALEKAGHITLHKDTGKKVWGGNMAQCRITAWYVDDGEDMFTYNGRMYKLRYYSGCFYPFVIECEKEYYE